MVQSERWRSIYLSIDPIVLPDNLSAKSQLEVQPGPFKISSIQHFTLLNWYISCWNPCCYNLQSSTTKNVQTNVVLWILNLRLSSLPPWQFSLDSYFETAFVCSNNLWQPVLNHFLAFLVQYECIMARPGQWFSLLTPLLVSWVHRVCVLQLEYSLLLFFESNLIIIYWRKSNIYRFLRNVCPSVLCFWLSHNCTIIIQCLSIKINI